MVHERGSGGQFYGVKVKEDSDMEKGLTGLWISLNAFMHLFRCIMFQVGPVYCLFHSRGVLFSSVVYLPSFQGNPSSVSRK